MDPSATLLELLESIAARDSNAAEEALENLMQWIKRGGYIPESIHAAMDAVRFAEYALRPVRD